MSSMGIVVVKFPDAIARVLERIEIGAGRGVTFGAGVDAPFVASLPVVGSRAPTTLSQGGCDCRVVAASSIPEGVCSFHHSRSRPVGARSYRFSHGRR